MCLMCFAIRRICSSDSITFGPANKKNGSASYTESYMLINIKLNFHHQKFKKKNEIFKNLELIVEW